MRSELARAYAHCTALARGHYENFPVASLLLPQAVRPHIAAVYAFARTADDMADEGKAAADLRLRRLHEWREQLSSCRVRKSPDPVFIALADTLDRYSIPDQLFHDLLDAFEQDVTTTAYDTFEDLLFYCRRSANPVGRILLFIFGVSDPTALEGSDYLCTGLQLANFWQDVSVDRRKPRVYIPKEDMERFGVRRADLDAEVANSSVRALVRFEVERTRKYFTAALGLLPRLPFRFRVEIRAIWEGGMRILSIIEKNECDVVGSRPALKTHDILAIVFRMIFHPTRSIGHA